MSLIMWSASGKDGKRQKGASSLINKVSFVAECGAIRDFKNM